jgi:hypothetical protein
MTLPLLILDHRTFTFLVLCLKRYWVTCRCILQLHIKWIYLSPYDKYKSQFFWVTILPSADLALNLIAKPSFAPTVSSVCLIIFHLFKATVWLIWFSFPYLPIFSSIFILSFVDIFPLAFEVGQGFPTLKKSMGFTSPHSFHSVFCKHLRSTIYIPDFFSFFLCTL